MSNRFNDVYLEMMGLWKDYLGFLEADYVGTNDYESHREKETRIYQNNLPEWIHGFLPELPQVQAVEKIGNNYVLVDLSTKVGNPARITKTFNSVHELAEYVGIQIEHDYVYSRDVRIDLRPVLENSIDVFVSGEVGVRNSNNKIRRNWTFIAIDYIWFLDFYDNIYSRNKDNAPIAYKFLDHHPVFWNNDGSHRGFKGDWVCDRGSRTFTQYPYYDYDDENNILKSGFCIEGGAHIEPEYKYHCHDLDLDTYAESLDMAIIEYAKKIDEKFHPDGSQRNQ